MQVMLLVLCILLYALVTFFGLGPVLYADGTVRDRMMTLAVVAVLYALITWLLVWSRRRLSRSE